MWPCPRWDAPTGARVWVLEIGAGAGRDGAVVDRPRHPHRSYPVFRDASADMTRDIEVVVFLLNPVHGNADQMPALLTTAAAGIGALILALPLTAHLQASCTSSTPGCTPECGWRQPDHGIDVAM